METIGKRIALYRNSRRWTQEKLASNLGIAQALLSDFENDKVSPKWDMINRIAEQLEIPLLSLLPLSNNVFVNPSFCDTSSNNSNITNQTFNNNKQEEQKQLYESLLKAKDEVIELLRSKISGHI